MAGSAGSVITYRASRQILALLVSVGVAVVLFGVFGAVIFRGSLQGQYFATIAIGVGVIVTTLSRRLMAPMSTTLTASELICRFSGSERRIAIEDIAGVALVQYSQRVPIGITYHGWMPGYWTRTGTLYSLAGTTTYGTPADDVALLTTSRAARIARDLYTRVVALQGQDGPVLAHKDRPIPGPFDAVIEILGDPAVGGDRFERWDASTGKTILVTLSSLGV